MDIYEKTQKLIKLMQVNSLTEIEIEIKDFKIKISKKTQ